MVNIRNMFGGLKSYVNAYATTYCVYYIKREYQSNVNRACKPSLLMLCWFKLMNIVEYKTRPGRKYDSSI